MRRILLLLIVACALPSTAFAQKVYSVKTAGFTPAATATDMCVLGGSASAVIKVIDVRMSGTATAASTIDVLLVKRSAANTSGTFVGGTVVPHDTFNTSVAPTVGHYTANPSINGTVGTVAQQKVLLPIVGTVGTMSAGDFNMLPAPVVLRGTAQQLALNNNSVAIPSGGASYYCQFTWIEE